MNFDEYKQIEFEEELIQIKNTWDIFSLNGKAIQQDFDLITEGKPLSQFQKVFNV